MAVASLVAKVEAQVATFQKQFVEATRTAQRFEKDFANAASSVTAQQRRISDAFSSFSGDRLAREALSVAKAIEQVGGASKLTAAEQAQVNAKVTEALAKYQALGQTAPKALIDLEQATRKVEAATVATQRTTSIFGQSLDQLQNKGTLSGQAMGVLTSTFGQFTAAGVAVGLINRLGGALSEFVSTGVKLGPVQASFDRLADAVGEDSGKMLSSLQGATRGLVSNYDLMLASNKAMLLGLPVTSESMSELARTASVLGKAMGQDATKSFDDLITALGRSSPLILDNLGLTVRVEEANQKYAAALGKTADSLTDAEKKMAFYTEAMTKARERTQQIGEQTLTLGEIFTTVWTKVGNVVSGAVSAINTAGGTAVSETAGALSRIGSFLSSLATNGVRGAVAMSLVNDQMTRVAQSANAGVFAKTGAAAEDFAGKVRRLQIELGQLTDQQRRNIEAGQLLGKSNKEIADSQTGLAGKIKITEDHLSLLDKLERQNAEAKRGLSKAAKELEDRLSDEAKAHEAAARVLRLSFRALQDYVKENRVAKELISEFVPELESLQQKLTRIRTAQEALVPTLKAVNDQLAEQQRITRSIIEQASRGLEQEAAQRQRDFLNLVRETGAAVEELGAAFGFTFDSSVMPAIENAVEGFITLRKEGTSTYEKLAIAAQGVANVVRTTGSQSRTSAVLGGAASGFQTGAAIGSIVPGLGTVAGGVIGGIAGGIIGFVRSANQGREAVEAFANSFDGFDGLHEKLLAMGDDGERLWVNLTQGVGNNNPAQAAAAIGAIQEAFRNFNADPIGAAIEASGFRTRAQLEELAATATSVYERMRDSGEFTASTVQEAFERMQEAQAAAFGDSTGTDSLKARIQELTSEYDALFKSIENEAPEAVMGDVERATRARMEAIQQQSEAAQREQDDITRRVKDGFTEIGPAARDAADAIGEVFRDVRINIPIQFIVPDLPTLPGSGTKTLAFGSGSGIPQARPTSAATFGGGGNTIIVKTNIDGRQAAEAIVPHIPTVVRRRG